jgi:hypothetical protein
MLARMSSAELTGWMVLFEVHAEEEQYRRDVGESGDGQVNYYGRDDDVGDDDEDGEDVTDGGETE